MVSGADHPCFTLTFSVGIPVRLRILLAVPLLLASASTLGAQRTFELTSRDYFHRDGVDVMAFQDFYPDGHQGGVTIVQHGVRVAANGDVRLEPTPGQWSPSRSRTSARCAGRRARS